MDHSDVISNPMAPPSFVASDDAANRQSMSNSDFRKLMMTPRAPKDHHHHANANKEAFSTRSRPLDPESQPIRSKNQKHSSGKSRSHNHQNMPHQVSHRPRKPSEDSVNSSQYRDRARERREGRIASSIVNAEPEADTSAIVDQEDDQKDLMEQERLMQASADYRAVAPTGAAASLHAERRKAIEKSKYFGGDMEHTHLVKGLDYVLLQKVRTEIQNKEVEAEEQLDAELQKPLEGGRHGGAGFDELAATGPPQFKTRLAAGIYEAIFRTTVAERNEYFQPGRMAYRVDLAEDGDLASEFEVPATVIRSKADCPLVNLPGHESGGGISTNDIVVNKLTQIFSYLRAGRRQAKKAKALQQQQKIALNDEEYALKKKHSVPSVPIFDDAPKEYLPTRSSNHRESHHRSGEGEHHRHNKHSSTSSRQHTSDQQTPRYFEKPEFESGSATTRDTPTPVAASTVAATNDFVRDLASKYTSKNDNEDGNEKAHLDRLLKRNEISGYDECYPGFVESYDAMGDSDDETDFSKMDIGSKKGPIGRWDFETQEEYGEYMSAREAMPKAAFQYGVKKPEGRKTRRLGPGGGQKASERAAEDRELQQINNIINKRKLANAPGGEVKKSKF